MLVIDHNSMKALRDRVLLGEHASDCLAELRKVIEIKSSLQWRADAAYACVGGSVAAHLSWELKELEEALWALEDGRNQEAAAKLDEMIKIMEPVTK